MSERNSQRDRGRTRPREERSRSNERNRVIIKCFKLRNLTNVDIFIIM